MNQPHKTLHLLYHEVEPSPGPYRYTVSAAEFEAHCAALRGWLDTRHQVEPRVTFDDGHRSVHDHALPVLARHRLRAHLFLTAGWIGQRAGYMDWPELRACLAAGQRMGAHGWSHALLTHCTDAELHHELAGARALLEEGLGVPVTSLSFPGGRFDARVLRACAAAGYTELYTSVPRAEPVPQGRLTGRVNLRQGLSAPDLLALLAPGSPALRRLYLLDRAKATARTVLGDRRYARLWARLNRQSAEQAADEQAGEPAR